MGTSVGVWFWGMLAAVILLGLSDTGRSDDTSGEETKSETTTEEQTEEGGWMCAVGFVEEEELYIDEWLAYHRILGFDYFFLCDGGNNASLGEFLRAHAEAGYVAVVPWPHSTADDHVGGCLKLALDIMHASTYLFLFLYFTLCNRFHSPSHLTRKARSTQEVLLGVVFWCFRVFLVSGSQWKGSDKTTHGYVAPRNRGSIGSQIPFWPQRPLR